MFPHFFPMLWQCSTLQHFRYHILDHATKFGFPKYTNRSRNQDKLSQTILAYHNFLSHPCTISVWSFAQFLQDSCLAKRGGTNLRARRRARAAAFASPALRAAARSSGYGPKKCSSLSMSNVSNDKSHKSFGAVLLCWSCQETRVST